jgi:hypothetical protein
VPPPRTWSTAVTTRYAWPMVHRARVLMLTVVGCAALALSGESSVQASYPIEKPTARVVHVSLDGSEIQVPTLVVRLDVDGPATMVATLPRTARRVLRTTLDVEAPEPLSRFFRAELDDPSTFALFAAPGPGSARPIRSDL